MWNKLSSFKISKKLAAVFLILLIMMAVGGTVGLYNARQIANVTTRLYMDFLLHQENLSSIEKEFLTEKQETFLYAVIYDTGSRVYLERSIAEHDRKIKELLGEHLKLETDSDKELYRSFEKAWSDYMAARNEAIKLSNNGNRENALAMLRNDVEARFAFAMDILQVLLSEEKNSSFSEYQRVGRLSAIITWGTIAFTILAIIASIGLWSILTRSIVKPIEALEESAKKISDGNLKERVSILSTDEIGELAAEFNKMAEHLDNYYATLEKKVEERTETIRIANEELFKKKQETEMLNEELVKANKMKSQFLANVSHELRTPLNSILGFSELLTEKSFGELNEKQTQYVNYIHTSGSHLLQLINNILDLSKIEAGKLELEMEDFPLSDVLNEILDIIRPLAHKKGVVVECKNTPTSPTVKLDRSKFKQIMLNLLSNAVKFNKDGGSVNIEWDIMEETRSSIVERTLHISVKDTGIGIKNEDIARIFREFEQLDPSITREYGGTGLGLALTKKLVELHSGRVWLDSKHGKGTTFVIAIPQGVKGLELANLDIKDNMQGFQKQDHELYPVILVASESKNLNELIKTYLVENGYSVELAEDGNEVLEKASTIKPFAVIVGISLPNKDGWEVLQELKASPDTCEIPVIIASAAANNNNLGFSLGAADYLSKPVDKDKLLYTLGRLSFPKKAKKQPFSILAIDDEPQVLEFLGDVMEKEGFVVLRAANGEDGIALAIERDPDLIILDLMMPRVSGFDVVDQLKQHPIAKDIPIIIFTAKDISAPDKTKLGNSVANIIKKADFSKGNLLNEIKKLEMVYPARAMMIDPMTRAFNRRYFSYWIVQEMARGRRYGLPFSMLLVDIDRLSEYNAKNGFLIGNELLIELSKLIENNIRKADSLIRYGGDEFIIVLPNITKEGAAVVAEKLRIKVENHGFPSLDGKRNEKITISVGIADFPSDGKRPSELMLNIGQAANSAFKSGGNKISVFRKVT